MSLTQQVILLFFSGIRGRQGRSPKRILLWLAYQLADSTAMYALGNLSLSSTLRQHRLVAFWAPFLLLHLAGPDNITAYSFDFEDNKLWKRHLLTLVVHFLGAGYVVSKHIAGSGILFSLGATLMTIVAVAKFCGRHGLSGVLISESSGSLWRRRTQSNKANAIFTLRMNHLKGVSNGR